MIDLANLFAVGLAFSVVMVSPGPANIANATIAMSHGRRDSLRFAAGLATGLSVWGLVAATGLGAILQHSLFALTVMKLFGGAYLLWLAWHSGRAALRPDAEHHKVIASGQHWFLRGILFNLSNPKSVLAWMAALSMGVGQGDGPAAMAIATAMCVVLGFANNLGHSLVFSTHGMMAGYRRLRRWIEGMVSGIFALAGFGLIRSVFAK